MESNDDYRQAILYRVQRLDADELIGYFAPDASTTTFRCSRSLPCGDPRLLCRYSQPVPWTTLRNLAQVTQGDVVMNERIDHFDLGDRSVSLLVAGIFELRDGKITAGATISTSRRSKDICEARVMKLASMQHGRDGRLVVVDRALERTADASPIAQPCNRPSTTGPKSRRGSKHLSQPREKCVREQPFDQTTCAARCREPINGSTPRRTSPRRFGPPGARRNDAGLLLDRSADVSGRFGCISRGFRAYRVPGRSYGIDFEGEIAVMTGDVPMNPTRAKASGAIKLLLLINDISLRNLIPGEIAKGFGFLQAKPSSAMSPVAVTPDELGDAWDGGRLHLPLLSTLNGIAFGRPNAGIDHDFDFPTLIIHAARNTAADRRNRDRIGHRLEQRPRPRRRPPDLAGGDGYSCIAEIRTVETILTGQPRRPS